MNRSKLIFLIILIAISLLSIDALTNRMLSIFSPFLLFVLLHSWVLFFLYNVIKSRLKSETTLSIQTLVESESKWFTSFFMISSVVLAVLIVSLRFLYFPRAQGPDVPDYLFYTNLWMRGKIVLDTFFAERGLSLVMVFLIRQVVESVLRLSYDASFMITPVIMVIFYCLSVYRFTKVGTHNKLIGSVAAALTPLTFFTIRLSYDLYGNLLGLILAMLFFSYYLENLRNNSDKKATLFGRISMALILLAHVMTYIFVIQALAIFVISGKLFGESVGKKARTTFKIIYPSLLLGALVFIYFNVAPLELIRRPLVADFLYSFTQELRLFSPPPGWSSYALNESALLFFLSILGTISLLKSRDNFAGLLMAWVLMVYLYVMVLSYQQSYRMLLYLPTMIFAALGLSFLLKFCNKLFQNMSYALALGSKRVKFDYKVLETGLLFLIFMTLTVSVLPRPYISHLYYERPSEELERQLNWIAKRYGYGNDRVLILAMYDENYYPHMRRWMHALSGNDVYVGELIRFLNGQPDWLVSGSTAAWLSESMIPYYRSNLSQYSLIIMPETIYSIRQFDRFVSNKVEGQNIYVFQMPTILQTKDFIEHFVLNNSVWSDDTFDSGWALVSTEVELKHNFLNNGTGLTIQIENSGENASLVYEKVLPEIVGTRFFFLKVKGNLTSEVRGSIMINHKDSNETIMVYPDPNGKNVMLSSSEYVWMYSDLDVNKVPEKISLVVQSDNGSLTGAYYVQIDLIALV